MGSAADRAAGRSSDKHRDGKSSRRSEDRKTSRGRSSEKRHRRSKRSESADESASSGSEINNATHKSKRSRKEEERPAQTEGQFSALEAEVEKRRKRIEAWRQMKAAEAARKQENGHAAGDGSDMATSEAAGEEEEQEPVSEPGWNLEDDALSSGDEEGGDVNQETESVLAAELERPSFLPALRRSEDEEDEENVGARGLGAMLSQAAPVESKVDGGNAKPAEEEEEEIDPLDAFMAGEMFQEQALAPKVSVEDNEATTAGEGKPNMSSAANNGAVSHRSDSAAGNRHRRPRSRYGDSSSELSDDGSSDGAEGPSEEEDDAAWMRKLQQGKLSKGERLVAADHSKIDYPPFRRNFYREPDALRRLSEEEVSELRAELDGIRVRGKDVPRPLTNWHQAGLSGRVHDALRRDGFDAPLPIQAQALPAIMSGRDTIGIAKTGSGKTLAYVLPLLRHVKDQSAVESGEGPIALIVAPTRELVTQITREIRRLGKTIGVRCVAVYGGSGVASQISELKRGAEAVVCTPGRMIDILVTSGGKITNLRRVTYLVLDEADRMFDMGFEPQIMRMVNNVRPDRQIVMFSATFPRSVEALARQLLHDPVEIQVGGRSVVNRDIEQFVEIRPEEDRFWRLLEILGEWYERGKLLVFVASQERCDNLFRDLLKHGYPCLSLHGGKDQSDRESTISDFKSDVCNILVATSVAARGLDVKDLVLVVNYDVPNHLEDYVHRVGRTGRAGKAGTAITFLSPEEDQYAPDIVRALRESGAAVPADLQALADGFEAKRRSGTARAHGSGFGGSGFKFSSAEDNLVKALRRVTAREYGILEADEEEEGADNAAIALARRSGEAEIREVVRGAELETTAEKEAEIAALPPEQQAIAREAQRKARETLERLVAGEAGGAATGATISGIRTVVVGNSVVQPPTTETGAVPAPVPASAFAQPSPLVLGTTTAGIATTTTTTTTNPDILAAAARISQQINAAAGIAAPSVQQQQPDASVAQAGVGAALPGGRPAGPTRHFETELEINDFPQRARWRVTHRDTINDIGELGAAVVIKGTYYPPGARIPEGDRKIYLHIEGPTEQIVRRAKNEIKRIIEEETERAMRRDAPVQGRYNIL